MMTTLSIKKKNEVYVTIQSAEPHVQNFLHLWKSILAEPLAFASQGLVNSILAGAGRGEGY